MPSSKVFEEKYKQLNAKQREAVDTIYGPVMVVAGPGTGKTTVLTLRVANILAKTDAKSEEILALTFTENGARNMREKLREIIGDVSFRVNIFTFHAFANHMRGMFPECFGRGEGRLPTDDATKLQILESAMDEQSFKELRITTFGLTLKKIAGRISDLKRELIFPKNLEKLIKKEEKNIESWKKSLEKSNKTTEREIERKEKYIARLNEFAHLYELYTKELDKRSLYDFDDAIIELVEALKSNPDMAAEMRETFQFVLADEHQDANGAQNEILKMFRGESIEKPNVFVVGDDKQSIFRFQGASLEHFYNFNQEFPGAQKIALVENYRSHKIILNASHSLIEGDGGNHQKLSANVPYEERKIDIVEYPEYKAELFDTAKRVKEILDKRGDREKIAIIARNNKVLFDIAQYLEIEKVKFKIAGERSLFEDHEYIRLMYLFEALSNPYEGALLKALYAGYFGADIADVIALASLAKKERKDFAVLYLQMREGRKIKDLIVKAKKMEAGEFLKELRSEMQSDVRGGFEALRTVFDEAKAIIKRNRGATLDDLIAHLKFLEKHNLTLLEAEKAALVNVELLSVHRAKGLEYDYVFVIDATSKRFEDSGGRADLLLIPGVGTDTELSEERRLLYVALTRAKQHVSVSYALSNSDGGDVAPSVLLSEIDPTFVEKQIFDRKIERPDLLSVMPKSNTEQRAMYRDVFLQRNFSVSALNNFLNCPWKYFFRNLLLLPEPAEFAGSLGNACHECLRIFHTNAKRGKLLKKAELRKLVALCVNSQPFSKSELPVALEKAEKSIFAYVDSFKAFADGEKVFVEDSQSFVYKAGEGDKSFDVSITGKIDLAREADGVATVIDFKTKKRMTINEIKGETKNSDGNEWRQLQFYKFLLENTKKDVDVSSGVLTFLTPERGQILSETFELTNENKAQIERALLQALLSIYNLDFWGSTCEEKNCEYCNLSKLLPK